MWTIIHTLMTFNTEANKGKKTTTKEQIKFYMADMICDEYIGHTGTEQRST